MAWLAKLMGQGAESEAGPGDQEAGPPARVRIDSAEYPVADIGVRSFRLASYDGGLIAPQRFDFTMIFVLDEDEYEFAGRGIVRGISARKGLTAYFYKPPPFFERLWGEFVAEWMVARAAQDKGKR